MSIGVLSKISVIEITKKMFQNLTLARALLCSVA